jgi:hypothetical protein
MESCSARGPARSPRRTKGLQAGDADEGSRWIEL